MTREDADQMNVVEMLNTIIPAFIQCLRGRAPKIVLDSPETNSRTLNRFTVIGHNSRLGQVIINLLENAVSFSPKRSTVTVSARRVGGEVEITVEDEGPGIPPDNLSKIFDRFYTDRPGEEAFGKNSGLGLNISQQIVTAHGGKIWAENRKSPARDRSGAGSSRRRGARFVVLLPAATVRRA